MKAMQRHVNVFSSHLILRGYIFYQLLIERNYVLIFSLLHVYPFLEKLDKSKLDLNIFFFFLFVFYDTVVVLTQ